MDMTRIREDSYEIQHVVFKRKLENKEFGSLAIFTRPSGDDIAVAVLPQNLELCQVLILG